MSATILDFRKAERILRGSKATEVREARLRGLYGPKQPPLRAYVPPGVA